VGSIPNEIIFFSPPNLLLVESLDLHQSNQYILVREIPSFLRFAKMCVCQVSVGRDEVQGI
jgi:hypothetical protein